MSDDNMTPEGEKRLFADVEIIKHRQGQSDAMIQNLLKEFVEHSKSTSDNLNKLTLSSQELVQETRSSNHRLDELEKIVDASSVRNEDNFKALGRRVVLLENFKLTEETIAASDNKSKKWWSDNWHKILMVFVISIPSIAALYDIVSK